MIGDENPLLTMHDPQHHVSFRQHLRNVLVIGMGTAVDNSIHIQVQVIEFRQQGLITNNFIDFGSQK